MGDHAFPFASAGVDEKPELTGWAALSPYDTFLFIIDDGPQCYTVV